MNDRPITDIVRQLRPLSPDDNLAKAVSVLRASQVQALPVTQNGRVVGLVREALVLEHLAGRSDREASVSTVMEPNPTCGNIYMTIGQAADLMTDAHAELLPVIDEFGSYRGAVARSDVLAAQMNALRPPAVGGMATPIGVHLTTGAVSAGAGNFGLYLTGAALMLMVEAARAILQILAYAADKLFSTHLLTIAASPPTGLLSWVGLRADAVHYVVIGLQIVLMPLLLRLSPMSGYHAAEHQVVHTIEAGEPLIPEIVSRMPRAHPRCGTNLLAAAALFLIIATGLGTAPGVLVAMIVVIMGWRTIGYYLQQYITTKPPSQRQVQNGIKVGEELLAKYRREPNKPIDGWTRIWNMGILQVAMGWGTVLILDQLFLRRFFGLTPWL